MFFFFLCVLNDDGIRFYSTSAGEQVVSVQQVGQSLAMQNLRCLHSWGELMYIMKQISFASHVLEETIPVSNSDILESLVYMYESRWLFELKKIDPQHARKFAKVYRYIDDLISFNDDCEFMNSYLEIYLLEMLTDIK